MHAHALKQGLGSTIRRMTRSICDGVVKSAEPMTEPEAPARQGSNNERGAAERTFRRVSPQAPRTTIRHTRTRSQMPSLINYRERPIPLEPSRPCQGDGHQSMSLHLLDHTYRTAADHPPDKSNSVHPRCCPCLPNTLSPTASFSFAETTR